MQNRTHFPLVGDDEPVVGPPIQMVLYDDKDLISNIRGDYQEPDFVDKEPSRPLSSVPEAPVPSSRPSRSGQESGLGQKGLSDQEWQYQAPQRRARKESLRHKQSAGYFTPSKPTIGTKGLVKNQATKLGLEQEMASQLTAAADRLRQTTYILADLQPTYDMPDNSAEKPQKNSYDFLKQSQVYNYEENRKKKEKKVAQELNLTRFEQREKL